MNTAPPSPPESPPSGGDIQSLHRYLWGVQRIMRLLRITTMSCEEVIVQANTLMGIVPPAGSHSWEQVEVLIDRIGFADGQGPRSTLPVDIQQRPSICTAITPVIGVWRHPRGPWACKYGWMH
eukprot:7239138-Prymnesium_polylepis.1